MCSENISQSLHNIRTVFLDSKEFELAYAGIKQVVACRVIGDDIAYNKYLNKQMHNRDNTVRVLQDHLARFSLIKQHILKLADAFYLSGFARVTDVIKFVVASPTVTHERGSFWSICAMTGKTSNKVSIWKFQDERLAIDVKYEAFLIALWTIFNVEDIEITKASSYLQQNKTLTAQNTMRETIEEYLDTTDTLASASLYWQAIRNIVESLELTILTMQQSSHAC